MDKIGSLAYENARFTFINTLRRGMLSGTALLATNSGAPGPVKNRVADAVAADLRSVIDASITRNAEDATAAQELAQLIGVATAHVAESVVELLRMSGHDLASALTSANHPSDDHD